MHLKLIERAQDPWNPRVVKRSCTGAGASLIGNAPDCSHCLNCRCLFSAYAPLPVPEALLPITLLAPGCPYDLPWLRNARTEPDAAGKAQKTFASQNSSPYGFLAAAESILRRGYEVIDTDWESVCGGHIDLVAKDHDELVFIDVTVSEGQEKGFLDGNPNQNQMEIMAARWLAASSPADGDLQVRFDTISLIVLNEQRAFLRHHTNVFSQA